MFCVNCVEVIVHHRNDMPAGLPAVWIKDGTPAEGVIVNLYLRHDLPQQLADSFRCMAVRDALPGIEFEAYAITDVPTTVPVLSPLQFA